MLFARRSLLLIQGDSVNVSEQLLRSRYRLVRGPINHDQVSETWIGHDEEDSPYLLKVWPYEGERPDDLQRALWDSELRNIYRLGSSPGADEAMLVVKDAGVDKDQHCFVMVLSAPGYESLSSNLRNRRQCAWLASSDPPSRAELWQGLRRVADGLILLHEQLVIHRDVRPETVFLDSSIGPPSMRLGGFEWSVRLGTPANASPPSGWSSPPEFSSNAFFGYRPETDWFAFGMLAARCFHNLEMFGNHSPVERHVKVSAEIERDSKLTELERSFLTRLIATTPDDRITRPDKISASIDDIIAALKSGPRQDERKPLVLVLNPRTSQPWWIT
jgi:serine/threonine protein kinase